MISSLLRPKRSRVHRDRSPFSSPFTAAQISPEGARRSFPNERRRAAADYNSENEDEDDAIEEEDEEGGDGNEGEDDEDGLGEATPLLPIFSAAHLGSMVPQNISLPWLTRYVA